MANPIKAFWDLLSPDERVDRPQNLAGRPKPPGLRDVAELFNEGFNEAMLMPERRTANAIRNLNREERAPYDPNFGFMELADEQDAPAWLGMMGEVFAPGPGELGDAARAATGLGLMFPRRLVMGAERELLGAGPEEVRDFGRVMPGAHPTQRQAWLRALRRRELSEAEAKRNPEVARFLQRPDMQGLADRMEINRMIKDYQGEGFDAMLEQVANAQRNMPRGDFQDTQLRQMTAPYADEGQATNAFLREMGVRVWPPTSKGVHIMDPMVPVQTRPRAEGVRHADRPPEADVRKVVNWVRDNPDYLFQRITGEGMVNTALDLEKGGFTVNPRTGGEPMGGYAVSVYPNRKMPPHFLTPHMLADASILNLSEDLEMFALPGHHIGGWVDGDGNLHVGPSVVVPDEDLAVRLGQEYNQQAVWDIAGGREIGTGGTGDLGDMEYGVKLRRGLDIVERGGLK